MFDWIGHTSFQAILWLICSSLCMLLDYWMEWIQEGTVFSPQVLFATVGTIFRGMNNTMTNHLGEICGLLEFIQSRCLTTHTKNWMDQW